MRYTTILGATAVTLLSLNVLPAFAFQSPGTFAQINNVVSNKYDIIFSHSSSGAVMESIGKQQTLGTVATKYGILNPFGVYYIVILVLIGLPWFVSLSVCQLLYKITGDKFDTARRIPMLFSQCWGEVSMILTGTQPKVEGRDILTKFYKE